LIEFHFVDIDSYLPLNSEKTINFLLSIGEFEGRIISDIKYIFTSDNYLLQINKQFLNHNYLTDVITFDNSNPFGLRGEIYISLEYVKQNYLRYSLSYKRELNRCIIHGLLHMIGYNDDSPINRLEMRKKENHYLGLI
jgi:rRNA maturation RNase YbeY